MDKPFKNGFICEKHKIGYIKDCPSCKYEKWQEEENRPFKES